MKRHILFAVAAVLALSGIASAQNLINDSGFDTAWVNNDDYVDGSGNVDTVTNYSWEWWGAEAWQLYGWNADGTHATDRYLDGQYGPTKAPRDFTAGPFNGTVPAFQTQMWTVPYEGSFNRTATGKNGEVGPSGAGDTFLEANSNYRAHIAVAAPDAGLASQVGKRVKLSFDTYGTDYRNEISVIGLSNNNQDRKPYFPNASGGGADCVSGSSVWSTTPLTGVVDPGPDYMVAWSSETTGQELLSTHGNMPGTAGWATYSESFFMPAPETARGIDGFDHLGLDIYAFGTAGFDNIQLSVIQPGDANEDLAVDLTDLIALGQNYGAAGDWYAGDFNNDGTVDLSDLIALGQNYGNDYSASSTPGITVTPEPATMSLLGLGGLALLRRRKK